MSEPLDRPRALEPGDLGSGVYDSEFYRAISAASRSSAEQVLPLVVDLVRPRRVVDVGCGTAAWLRVIERLAGCTVLGVDGPHVPLDQLEIPTDRFLARDLGDRLELDGDFDLVLSLEVAEHLPEHRAATFVQDLTRLAPAVLFSAAVPGQGGEHHVNEQWQSYWIDRFARQGFDVWDVVRPAVWDDDRVEYYFRQNIFLFVDRSSSLQRPSAPASLDDVVHPEMFRRMRATDSPQTLRSLVAQLPAATSRAVRHRVGRPRAGS